VAYTELQITSVISLSIFPSVAML